MPVSAALAPTSSTAPCATATAMRSSRLTLLVPPPGHIAVEAVKIHVTGKNMKRVAAPKVRLVGTSVARAAAGLVLVHTIRPAKSATITFFAITVNRGTGTARRLAATSGPVLRGGIPEDKAEHRDDGDRLRDDAESGPGPDRRHEAARRHLLPVTVLG